MIKGIDVSHFEGSIDWEKVKQAGFVFAFAKASQGASFKDGTFQNHRILAKKAGLLFGAYHFFDSAADVASQLRNFIAVVGSIPPGELQPQLDLEPVNKAAPQVLGWPARGVASNLADAIDAALGVKMGVYGDASFLGEVPSDSPLAGRKLWVAQYGVESPKLPPAWPSYFMWQRSESESVPGVGECDVNIFQGTLAEFQAAAVKEAK